MVEQSILQPLMGLAGALIVVSLAFFVSWKLWVFRRHGWAALISTLPFLLLLYLVGSAISNLGS